MKPDRTMCQIDAPMSMLHRLKKMACGIGTTKDAMHTTVLIAPLSIKISIVAVRTAG